VCRGENAAKEQFQNAMATKPVSEKVTEIKLAHSPDSDDAFMFYGLATQKVRTPGLKFSHLLADIETLNQAAQQELYDVTAFSFGAYPYLRDKYALLDCGASFGEGYGPIVVSQHPMKPEDLAHCRTAVPGLQTSAFLSLRMFEPRVEPVVMSFDQILDAVKNSVVDAGLLIHEGQLFFPQMGLHKVIDLGQWWIEQTGLPLPLGGNAVRRALGRDMGLQIGRAIRESVSFSLDHREAAVNYAMQFARDMEPEMADKFIGMYVNKWTLGYGERGRQAVNEFLKRGVQAGLIPGPAEAEFLRDDE
jgi:5,8-dihydroxy-2-naphthoate synthase